MSDDGMRIECTTRVFEYPPGVLGLVTDQKIGDAISEFYRGVLNTQERAVKDALVKLGWTPPGTPRPLDDYHEDHGPALWWAFPINEPPYVGSPLDSDWPGYHTHWTPIVCPKEPA